MPEPEPKASETATSTPANGKDAPLGASADSWSLQWEAAERKVAELEGKIAKEPKAEAEKKAAPGRDATGKFTKQEEPEPETEEPAEEEKEPIAAKDGDDSDEADKRAQLQALASELGLRVDDRGVTSKERKKFYRWKEETKQSLGQRAQQIAQREAQLNQVAAPLTTAIKAVQEGDYDAAMRELGRLVKDEELEREGLNGATKKYLRRAQGEDPRVDSLMRELREKEKREGERQRQEAEYYAQQQQAQEQQRYLHSLGSELADVDDDRVAALAQNPAFVQQVFAIQQREWDGSETVTAAEAAQEALGGLQKTYRLLDSVFGGRDTVNPDTAERSGDHSSERPRRRAPRPLKKGEAAEASPKAPVSTDPLKWRDKWSKILEQSTK